MQGDYSAIHPHIRFQEQSYITGLYYNSESNISLYGGKRWKYNDFGLEAGAVTGYTTGDILPYARATYKDFFIAPAVEGENTVGLVVGYELKW